MSQVLQALSLQGVVWMFDAIYRLLADSGMAFCQTFRMQNEAKLMIDTYANYIFLMPFKCAHNRLDHPFHYPTRPYTHFTII